MSPQRLQQHELLVPSASPAERLRRQSSPWTAAVTWCPSSPCWDPVRTGTWACRERTCALRTAAGCSGSSLTSSHGTRARTAALRTRWGGPLWCHAVEAYRVVSERHSPKSVYILGLWLGNEFRNLPCKLMDEYIVTVLMDNAVQKNFMFQSD